jgi:hypothetical protein
MNMSDENEITEADVVETKPDVSPEDRALMDKIALDLVETEKELMAHGSSVRQLLANVAKHSLGVIIQGVAVKPVADKPN